MILTKSDLKYYLDQDKRANGFKTSFKSFAVLLFDLSEKGRVIKYLCSLRHLEFHSNNHSIMHRVARLYYLFRTNRLGTKYHIQIRENSTGYGLRICHLSCGGIILNCNYIGNFCTINTGVILGNRHTLEDRPFVGDNVVFCPGSQAFGSIHIGNNAYVCPNATITKDVPDNAVVAGVPAKVIRMTNTAV